MKKKSESVQSGRNSSKSENKSVYSVVDSMPKVSTMNNLIKLSDFISPEEMLIEIKARANK